MRSHLAATLLILLLSTACTCERIEINNGHNASANNGETFGNTNSPAYRIDPRMHAITEYRDPRKYKAPEVPIDLHINNTTVLNPEYPITTEITSFLFQNEGLINGTGRSKEWRYMESSDGSKLKQSAYAQTGSVVSERNELLYDDYSDVGSIDELFSRSSIAYWGDSYTEKEIYRPREGQIDSYFRVGAISKDSRYLNAAIRILPDKNNPYYVLNSINSTANYRLNARFFGKSLLNARFLNSTAVSEEYVGMYDISRSISSKANLEKYVREESWLSCCPPLL
jgi:hypothetical protein